MSRRFKGYKYEPNFPQRLNKRLLEEIAAGEPWLAVWQAQLAVPHVRLAKSSKLSPERIDLIARGWDYATAEEMIALAAGLGTTVEILKESRALNGQPACEDVP